MIRLENLSAGYRQRTVLSGLMAEIPDASLVALAGRNGSGKSTLMRTMAGLQSPLGGQILYDGIDISSLSAAQRARKISFVNTERLRISGLTCHDLVALGRAPYTDWIGRLSAGDEAAVREALETVGLEDFAARKMDSMSDGECQMASIARAIAQDTPVMFLDEPTAFLDYPNRRKTASVLRSLASGRKKTVIWSTHDIESALEFSDCFIIVDGGSIALLSTSSPDLPARLRVAFGIDVRE